MSKKAVTTEQVQDMAEKSTSLIGKVANLAAKSFEEMDDAKMDKSPMRNITLPVESWEENTDEEIVAVGYLFSCTVPFAEATAADSAETTISPVSMRAAAFCGMCPTSMVVDGAIRHYAATVPTEPIVAQVRLITVKKEE